MKSDQSKSKELTPEQLEQGKRWVESWRRAGIEMERLRREKLANMDTNDELELLFGNIDPYLKQRAKSRTSGLIEQQRIFMKAAKCD